MIQPYILRRMRVEDIPQVVQIDEQSFPSPWSPRTYEFEITNRETSHLVVLEAPNQLVQPRGVGGLLRRLLGSKASPQIIGYGGCWLIAGEAHISTIAVHPDYRGRGLGELLLTGMLQRAMNLNGEYSVLEVRITNENRDWFLNEIMNHEKESGMKRNHQQGSCVDGLFENARH